jgi:O-antigen/teichoic acid export membrane protein
MWVSAIAVWVYLRVDQILIANLLSTTDLGRYAAAARLAESWIFVPTSIVTASFPALVQLRSRSPEQYRAGTERLLRLLAGIGIAFGLAATLLAPWIIAILFGPAYADATPVFQVLAWSGLFAAWGVARENWLVAEGLTRFSPMTTALGAVVNVGLNLILLPTYGILAAAWTTLLAQVMVVTLSMGLWPETRVVLRMQLAALAIWRTSK